MFYGSREFKRALQFDDYSCGAKCVVAVLRHFARPLPYAEVKSRLGTNENGTAVLPMLALLRAQGLAVRVQRHMRLADLARALARGVVITHVDGDHLAVVHGMDERFVYIADPAFARCAWRRQRRATFRGRWEGWGLTIRPRLTRPGFMQPG